MIEKTVGSIDEMLQFIHSLICQFGQKLWFRGVSNKDYYPIPSIQHKVKRFETEQYITNDFYIKARQVMDRPPEKHNYATWLSLMQHYGLPTRMLDWSKSPLIAAFFAVETFRTCTTDACIWVLLPGKLNEIQGFGSYLFPVDANTAQKMLLPAFKDHGCDEGLEDKILACHSTENNMRMYSQQAAFTIHNTFNTQKTQKGEGITTIEDLAIEEPNLLHRIIIPKEKKSNIYFALDMFGISTSYVYPDLDHISKDLKEQYGIK